jgi:hypothetical protein
MLVPDGGEFQVNTFTSSSQDHPAIAATKNGAEFVVFWRGPEPAFYPALRTGVIGQRFTVRGMPIGTEIQANFHPDRINVDEFPAVASSADGAFLVVWQDDSGDDGDEAGVFARWFDSAGMPRAEEFQVNIYTTGRQLEPRVAQLPMGRVAVVWSYATGPSNVFETQIRGRLLDAPDVGSAEFLVAPNTSSGPIAPAVAAVSDEAFLVVWQATSLDDGVEHVFGRLFGMNGVPRGSEFELTASAEGSDFAPDVAADGVGHVIVVWTRASFEAGTTDLDIVARRFSSEMDPLGPVSGQFVWSSLSGPREHSRRSRRCVPGGVDEFQPQCHFAGWRP